MQGWLTDHCQGIWKCIKVVPKVFGCSFLNGQEQAFMAGLCQFITPIHHPAHLSQFNLTRPSNAYPAPAFICSDNGPEFIAEIVRNWIAAVGAKTAYIEPGSTLGKRLL
jgi:hypothetical protein